MSEKCLYFLSLKYIARSAGRGPDVMAHSTKNGEYLFEIFVFYMKQKDPKLLDTLKVLLKINLKIDLYFYFYKLTYNREGFYF